MATLQELVDKSDKLSLLYDLISVSTRTNKDALLSRVSNAINQNNIDLEEARKLETLQKERDREAELKLREGEIDSLAQELNVQLTR